MDKQAFEHTSLVDILQWRAKTSPDKVAFTFLKDGFEEERSITFKEMDIKAKSLAVELNKKYGEEDMALLLYPQGIEHMCAIWACFYAGIKAVPLYLPQNERAYQRIKSIQADCHAKIVLTDSNSLERMEKRFDKMSEIVALDWFISDNIDKNQHEKWLQPPLERDSLAYLQYTSGSTGSPKGVMVSHGNLIYNLADMDTSWGHSTQSVLVSWLPIFHDMGLILGFLQGVYNGFRTIFYSPSAFAQRPFTWLKAVTDYKATHTGGPNSAYIMCIEKILPEQKKQLDLSSLKFMFNGSEPVRNDTLQQFTEAFKECGFDKKIHTPCYGLAEATLKVSSNNPDSLHVEMNVDSTSLESNRIIESINKNEYQTFVSSGSTELETEVIIVDPVSLARQNDGHVGEIWIKGPSVALGYYKKDADTKEIFQAHTSNTKEGPYLRTGDLGFMKEREIFIAGRLKDLIIIRGRNCYPQDIEEVVERSHSALAPSAGAAFSYEDSDEERLVIVQSIRRSHVKSIDPHSIFESIRRAVSSEFSVKVHSIELLMPASVPRTTSGKIQRRACKRAYLDKKLDVIASWKISA